MELEFETDRAGVEREPNSPSKKEDETELTVVARVDEGNALGWIELEL